MADTEALIEEDKKPSGRKAKAAAEATQAPADLDGGAKARFGKALDEARAGAQALGKEMQEQAGAYREKLSDKSSDLLEEARVFGEQAKERATALASDGKARASDALSSLGKVVADNAGMVDEKLGEKYGDYARTAARQIQEAAAKLEAKDLGELGEDAKEFVRKSPALAVGIAAVAGFLVARMFRKSED